MEWNRERKTLKERERDMERDKIKEKDSGI